MSRTTTLVGYGLIAVAVGGLQLASLVWRRTATLGQAASVVASRRASRWLLLAGWLWLGWHLFVRSHVAS